MASASEGPHPRQFPSLLADDFVVISDASSASPPNTPSPDEHQSKYSLSLLDHASSESDIQKLAKQIDGVSVRNSSLHCRLRGNSASIGQIHDTLLGRLNDMQKANQKAETALMLKTEQYQKLQRDNEKLREDYNSLAQKQEEWTQTYKDYSKLKNDYNLLTNTKERLESEKADLQRNRDEALAAETAKVKAEFDANLRSAIEAERARCNGQMATAQKENDGKLQAAMQDWDNCKSELLSKHKEAMETLQSHLEQQIQQLQADLKFSKSDSQSALDSEREKCRAELENLVSEHHKAMASMSTDYEAKISEQIALVEASRQELVDSNSKYEEEKRELFDQLRQLNLGGSFQHAPSSTDAETNMPSITSMCHTNMGSFQHVPSVSNDADTNMTPISRVRQFVENGVKEAPNLTDAQTNTVSNSNVFSDTDYLNAMDRPAVQEQASSTNSQQMADAATGMSLANSDAVPDSEPAAPVVSFDLARANMVDPATVVQTRTRQAADGSHGTLVSQCSEVAPVQLATKEVQTDELQQEFQVSNSDSLQREGTVRNLHMQLASFAQTLRTEREAKNRLELEQRQLQKECDDLRLQLRAAQSTTGSDQCQTTALQQTVGDLRTQLQKKQSELDSVLEDLDETRHKLYEHMENEKRQQCLLTTNEVQIEKLRQNIRELESQAEIEKSQLQMELESIRNGDQFKDTKLTAAQNEAENLKQELQRLKGVEDEINKRCRETDQTVQQIMESAEQEKQRLNEEIKQLKFKSDAQLEALESNKQIMEQKADLEMQLREEITRMTDRLQRKAGENDTLMVEANRKRDSLYNMMCDYSDQLANTKKQVGQTEYHLKQVNDRLKQNELLLAQANNRIAVTEQELRQSTIRLQESEKNASDLHTYSNNLGTELEKTKRQLQESSQKRDHLIQVAEQLRTRFEEELRRSAMLENELSKLKDEHTTVRADYSNMEQNVTQMLAKEHELQLQLGQAQNRLRQAEEAIEYHKRHAQGEVEKFNAEREQLNARINNLIDEITSANAPASNSSDNFLTRHRNSMRSPHGGGNA